jgi:hypothetical protein
MSAEDPCAPVRELLPELALGTVTGAERAHALEHLAGCARCRKTLADLAEVADGLLLLAPTRHPPVGFETRVAARLFGAGGARRWARWVAVAAVAVLVAFGSAASVLVATREERELGASYRRTLAIADGEYFTAAPLYAAGREAVGHVFGYQGSPSWLFLVVTGGARPGTYRIRLTTEDGTSRRIGEITLRAGRGSWGGSLPVDFHDVAEIGLRRGGRILEADV